VCFYAAVLAAFLNGALNAATVAPPGGPDVKTVALTKTGGWTQFRFDIELHGGVWLDAEANPAAGPLKSLSFQFSLNEKSTLQVTDAFRWGDVFEVFDDGVSLGQTSTPSALPNISEFNTFNDFTLAFSDQANGSRWSFGAYDLDPGDYIITGRVVRMPEVRGRAALRIVDFTGDPVGPATPSIEETVSQVPLPGTLPYFLAAGAIFAALSCRRAQKTQR